ncbi:MAG: hydroxyethylthiazole kinase [Clostridia bacterium]|nr:hydroxyethylthiazole kinase [Clostridia bacterium]
MLNYACLDEIKRLRPVVHCISNIVSVGDCANLALAVGAGPIMAQAPEEMAVVTGISDATVLNTGTPTKDRFEACLACGREARALSRPVVLDPVGVGASPWRLGEVEKLLAGFIPSVMRVNLGEAAALIGSGGWARGIDSPSAEAREEHLGCALELSKKYRAVVLLSGREDVVTDGKTAYFVAGGSDMMSRITGTGDMLSVLCGVFAAVEQDALSAAVLAAVFWKLCAIKAESAAGQGRVGSFHSELFNAAARLSAEEFLLDGQKLIANLDGNER